MYRVRVKIMKQDVRKHKRIFLVEVSLLRKLFENLYVRISQALRRKFLPRHYLIDIRMMLCNSYLDNN